MGPGGNANHAVTTEPASSNNGPYTLVASPTVSDFTDSGLTADTTYLYMVKAVDGASTVGPPSNIDLATSILYINDPIIAGSTAIKAVHVTRLRTAVNAVRVAAGMAPATFTDALAAGVLIKLVHISELRSNLNAARAAIGVPALQYTDPSLPAGTLVKASHIQVLRSGVK